MLDLESGIGFMVLSILLKIEDSNMKNKIEILMITGKGEAREAYREWLHSFNCDLITDLISDIANVEVSENLSVLNHSDLKRFDIVINNSMFLEPTAGEAEALLDFVKNGKSFLGLHTATVSFLNSPEYIRMIGGRFVTHDDIKTFTVNTKLHKIGYEGIEESVHPICSGVSDFTILDELYVVEGDFTGLDVIARAEGHPVMWRQPWGKGKSLYLALGHESYSIQNPGYRKLLRNGILWLAENL